MMMARKPKGLSDRHRKVLEVLEHYQTNQGYPPSIRDIGKEADISSTSVVNYYLEQLEEWGYIERDRKVSRGVRLIKTASGIRLGCDRGSRHGFFRHRTGCWGRRPRDTRSRGHRLRRGFVDRLREDRGLDGLPLGVPGVRVLRTGRRGQHSHRRLG